MSPHAGAQDERPVDVTEEVSRLVDAVQAWWTSAHDPSHGGDPDETAHQQRVHDEPVDQGPGYPGDDHVHDSADRTSADHTSADHTSSCRICPLCRALDLVRAVRPEVLQQVAAAAETVAVLLREAAGDRDRQAADQPPPPPDDVEDATSHRGTEGDLLDPFSHGTPIAVTDGREPSGHDHDDEGGRAAWA
jgi:hypothetical protein